MAGYGHDLYQETDPRLLGPGAAPGLVGHGSFHWDVWPFTVLENFSLSPEGTPQ